jgi:hypothetical protein
MPKPSISRANVFLADSTRLLYMERRNRRKGLLQLPYKTISRKVLRYLLPRPRWEPIGTFVSDACLIWRYHPVTVVLVPTATPYGDQSDRSSFAHHALEEANRSVRLENCHNGAITRSQHRAAICHLAIALRIGLLIRKIPIYDAITRSHCRAVICHYALQGIIGSLVSKE